MRARIHNRFASSTTTAPRPKPNSPPLPQPSPGQPTRPSSARFLRRQRPPGLPRVLKARLSAAVTCPSRELARPPSPPSSPTPPSQPFPASSTRPRTAPRHHPRPRKCAHPGREHAQSRIQAGWSWPACQAGEPGHRLNDVGACWRCGLSRGTGHGTSGREFLAQPVLQVRSTMVFTLAVKLWHARVPLVMRR